MPRHVRQVTAMVSATLIATAYVLPVIIEVADYRVVAHRGHAGEGPEPEHTENTLQALEAAQRAGATAVEVDLRLTRDGEILVMHDERLDRTTTCVGEVSQLTLAEVQRDCRGLVASEPLPDVRSVLQWGRRNQMHLLLELKVPTRDAWTVEDLTKLDGLVRRTGMDRRVSVSSFSRQALGRMKQVNPERRTHWIVRGWPGLDTVVAAADVAHVSVGRLTPNRVEALRRHGVRVIGRHTDRPSDWRKLRELGADGLVIDRTAEYNRWRADPEAPSPGA